MFNLIIVSVLYLTILLTIQFTFGQEKFPDYCNPILCSKDRKHIACNNTNQFAPECGTNPKIIEMTPTRILDILYLINDKRNLIANGSLEGYESAKRMPTVEWSTELANIAHFNVIRCVMKHDECRNTLAYPKCGQNIGTRSTTGVLQSDSENIRFFINRWFDEYKDANQSFIDSYTPHPNGLKIGHFTVLVCDRVQKVGCALIRFTEPNSLAKKRTTLVCNFSSTNILKTPVYNKGKPASECTTGTSEQFNALCSINEMVSSVPSKRKRPKVTRKFNGNI